MRFARSEGEKEQVQGAERQDGQQISIEVRRSGVPRPHAAASLVRPHLFLFFRTCNFLALLLTNYSLPAPCSQPLGSRRSLLSRQEQLPHRHVFVELAAASIKTPPQVCILHRSRTAYSHDVFACCVPTWLADATCQCDSSGPGHRSRSRLADVGPTSRRHGLPHRLRKTSRRNEAQQEVCRKPTRAGRAETGAAMMMEYKLGISLKISEEKNLT